MKQDMPKHTYILKVFHLNWRCVGKFKQKSRYFYKKRNRTSNLTNCRLQTTSPKEKNDDFYSLCFKKIFVKTDEWISEATFHFV